MFLFYWSMVLAPMVTIMVRNSVCLFVLFVFCLFACFVFVVFSSFQLQILYNG